jgi:NAD-dependent dihydropyrimidine dehydrogenase PreA subunit
VFGKRSTAEALQTNLPPAPQKAPAPAPVPGTPQATNAGRAPFPSAGLGAPLVAAPTAQRRITETPPPPTLAVTEARRSESYYETKGTRFGALIEAIEPHGDGLTTRVRVRPQPVDPARCTACGKCVPVCPVDLPAASGLPAALVLGGAVGVRVPGLALARELARLAGGPLVSTSANPAGGVSPSSSAGLAAALLERIDLVLDGGPTPGGLPSTVVEVRPSGARLLREGAVPWSEVEALLRSPLPSRGG